MQERYKNFTVLIAKITRCVRRIKTEEMVEFDLKSPHVSCIYYLYKEKSLTVKELTDICEEDKASLSRSIDYLIQNGFLVREAKTPSHYRSHLRLTEKGRLVGKTIADKVDNILMEAGNGLSEDNRRIFYESLALISDNLQRICDDYEANTHTV